MSLNPPFPIRSSRSSETVAHPPSSTATIEKLEESISNYRDALSSSSRCSRRRATLLATLAIKLHRRFLLSEDEQDLEMSILHYTHAIILPFQPSTKGRPNLLLV